MDYDFENTEERIRFLEGMNDQDFRVSLWNHSMTWTHTEDKGYGDAVMPLRSEGDGR